MTLTFTGFDQGNDYDVFKKLPGGSMGWVCAVASLQEARLCLRQLFREDPAEYYVCDLAAKEVLAAITPGQPELHALQLEQEPHKCSAEAGACESLRALVRAVAGCSSLDG
jgi:hypothetical protein